MVLLAAVLPPVIFSSAQAPPVPGLPVTSSAAGQLSLADGQAVVLRNVTRLSSATAKPGDPVEFRVIRRVSVDGLVVIPEKTVARGKVVEVVQKKSRGRGGKVVLDIEALSAITGQPVKLRGQSEHSTRSERGKAVAQLEAQTLGFGFLVIPAIILASGPDMEIRSGTRFEAFVDGTHQFDRDTLVAAQASIPVPREDAAEVYIYRRLDNKPEDTDTWPLTCGEAYVGTLDRGRLIHLVVPRGLYWLQYERMEIDMFDADPAKFFQLRVENGHSYYVRQVVDRVVSFTKRPRLHLEMVDEATGAAEVADLPIETGWLRVLPPDLLRLAQRQPILKSKKDKS